MTDANNLQLLTVRDAAKLLDMSEHTADSQPNRPSVLFNSATHSHEFGRAFA